MFFVSPRVVQSRPPGVKSGWYTIAVPGSEFEIRLTAVQQVFPSVHGRQLPKNHTVDAFLSVDGVRISNYRLSRSNNELVASGFIESTNISHQSRQGTETVRKFSFEKPTVSVGIDTPVSEDTGSISIEMISGKLVPRKRYSNSQSYPIPVNEAEVSEKNAEKGLTINVGRGAQLTQPYNRLTERRTKSKVVGSVTVFLREKDWLTRRHIVLEDGTPWTPVTDTINIDQRVEQREAPKEPSDPDASRSGANKKRQHNAMNGDDAGNAGLDDIDQPPRKIESVEVVDLTIDSD